MMIFSMEELKTLVDSLTFAFNNGKTPEEFGSFLLLDKLTNELSSQEAVRAKKIE